MHTIFIVYTLLCNIVLITVHPIYGSLLTDNPSKYEKFVPGLSNAKREIAKGDNSPKSKASAVLKGFEVCCGSSKQSYYVYSTCIVFFIYIHVTVQYIRSILVQVDVCPVPQLDCNTIII